LPLAAKLAGQSAQRFGGQARVGHRCEVVAHPLCHRPAEFARLGSLIRVGLAQLRVRGRRTGPLRHRRAGFPVAWRSPASLRVPCRQRTRARCTGGGGRLRDRRRRERQRD